jgi:hypothetical protein
VAQAATRKLPFSYILSTEEKSSLLIKNESLDRDAIKTIWNV